MYQGEGCGFLPGGSGEQLKRRERCDTPEQCSRKINLAFLGPLKLETLWDLHWVINDCSRVPKEDNLKEETLSLGDCPPVPQSVQTWQGGKTRPPPPGPPISHSLQWDCSSGNPYLGSEPGVTGGEAPPGEKLLDLQGTWVLESDQGSEPISTPYPAKELR